MRFAGIDLLAGSNVDKVVGVDQAGDGVTVTVETPDGRYALGTDWLVACDGVPVQLKNRL